MKRILLFFMAAIFISSNCIGQATGSKTFQNIIGPSPNAAAIDKYVSIPVSTYTGVPQIDIPIHNIVNRDLQLPVSLSYHAGGIRVDEEASRVGLGWALNAGGIINRTVNGNDDFFHPIGYLHNDFPEFFGDGVAHFFKSSGSNVVVNSSGGEKFVFGNTYDMSSYLSSPTLDDKFHTDLEPDVFSYNIPGYSGKFIIRKNRQIVKEKPDAVQIQLFESPVVKFNIIVPSGIKYVFDRTENCSFSTAAGTSNYTTSWYLSKIISPTGAEINFHYTTEGAAVRTLYSYTTKHTMFAFTISGVNCGPSIGTTSTYPPIKAYNAFYLDSISYPFGSVAFYYNSRVDIQDDKRLEKIKINNHNDPTKTVSYNLIQDYFTSTFSGNSMPDPILMNQDLFNKRLKLTGLLLSDANNNPEKKHEFTYNEQKLPTKKSFARDHWGFFNGQGNNNTLLPSLTFEHPYNLGIIVNYAGANKEASATDAQAYVLKQIKYPTGGVTSFEYETNDYSEYKSASGPNDNGSLPVTETKEFYARRPLDEEFTLVLPERVAFSNIMFEITSQNGQEPSQQQLSGDAFFEIYPQGSSTYIHRTLLGLVSFWQPDPSMPGYYKRTDQFDFPAGTYTIKTHFSANATFLNYVILKFTYTYVKTPTVANDPPVLGGGLRVSKISATDPQSGNTSVRKFQYGVYDDRNNDGTPEYHSYGRRLTKLSYTNQELRPFCNGNNSTAECDVFNLYSSSVIPMEGPVVGYDTTLTLFGETGQNGKEEYYYHNQPAIIGSYKLDFAGTGYEMYIRPSGVRDMVYLNNGAVKKKVVFRFNSTNSAFEKVNESEYNYISAPEQAILGLRRVFYETCNHNGWGWRLVQYPVFQSCLTRVSEEISREYVPGANTPHLETVNKYAYETGDPVHYQPVEIQSFTSKGQKKYLYATYPSDYASGTGFIDNMKSLNVQRPIEQVTVKELNGSKYVVSGGVIRYKESNASLAENIYSAELPAPLLQSAFKFSNRAAGVLPTTGEKAPFQPDPQYKSAVTFDQYDLSNNLVQQTKTDDISKSYVWDYYGIYPVCEAINAAVSDIAYTSFEADGTGNWSVGSTQRDLQSSLTGKKSYSLGLGSISKSGLDAAKNYTISYWTKNNTAFTIDGTVSGYPVKSASTTINGEAWTNYQHRITGRNTITVAGTGNIDELRLYPVNAQMTTYTYAPLIGMTAMMDAGDKITYYEYDNLSRLLHIRDKETNILKKFQYSYQSPVENAPQWTATGNTRCKPCPANDSYTSNIGQIEEKDNNIQSSTYNQTRWIDNGVSSSCTVNPNWQFTSTAIRCKVVNNVNTGEQEREQMDMRPCSATYGQTRWVVTGTNVVACPLPCTTANCSGEGFKCVNSVCEEGMRVCTHSVPIGGGMYRTYFHYEFSDGSWSGDSWQDGPFMCGN